MKLNCFKKQTVTQIFVILGCLAHPRTPIPKLLEDESMRLTSGTWTWRHMISDSLVHWTSQGELLWEQGVQARILRHELWLSKNFTWKHENGSIPSKETDGEKMKKAQPLRTHHQTLPVWRMGTCCLPLRPSSNPSDSDTQPRCLAETAASKVEMEQPTRGAADLPAVFLLGHTLQANYMSVVFNRLWNTFPTLLHLILTTVYEIGMISPILQKCKHEAQEINWFAIIHTAVSRTIRFFFLPEPTSINYALFWIILPSSPSSPNARNRISFLKKPFSNITKLYI